MKTAEKPKRDMKKEEQITEIMKSNDTDET
jgi:hypothetical protein